MEKGNKVKFKKGIFTQTLGENVVYTVTDVYVKGDELPNGDTYNGPDELYRIVTEESSVPAQLRILYEKECSIKLAEEPSQEDSEAAEA